MTIETLITIITTIILGIVLITALCMASIDKQEQAYINTPEEKLCMKH